MGITLLPAVKDFHILDTYDSTRDTSTHSGSPGSIDFVPCSTSCKTTNAQNHKS